MDETKKQAINQNLIDSGCSKAFIKDFFSNLEQGKIKETLKLLFQYRVKLLDNLYSSQKKIDCLDYLIFELKQK